MNKKIFTLLIFLCSFAATYAQQRYVSPIANARAHRWALPVANNSAAAEKTAAVKDSRLIKEAFGFYKGNGFPGQDSSYYQYSPTRGLHKQLGWMYDTLTSIEIDPGLPGGRSLDDRSVHTFRTDGKMDFLDVQNWDRTLLKWVQVANIRFLYTNNDLLSTTQATVINGVLTNVAKTEFNVNTVANTSTTLQQSWNVGTGQWEYFSREVTKYLSDGKIDTIRLENWNSNKWELQKATAYTYTNGNATLIERKKLNGSTWVPEYRETNTYNSSNDLTTTVFEEYDAVNGVWEDPMKEEYTYDNNKNLTQTIGYGWVSGAYVQERKDKQTYNGYNQVLVYTTEQWNPSSSQWLSIPDEDYQQRYYYEEYTTGISTIAKSDASFIAYPVPANDVLHIALPGNPNAIDIFLYDMQGRMVKKAVATHTADIQVSDLATGTYILKIGTGANKNISIIR